MANVKVLLVDDDALVRAGLRLILSSADDIDVVGETDDGAGAVAAVQAAPSRCRPDGHPDAADGRDHRDRGAASPRHAPAGHRAHHVPGRRARGGRPAGRAPADSWSRTPRPPTSSTRSGWWLPATPSCPRRSPAPCCPTSGTARRPSGSRRPPQAWPHLTDREREVATAVGAGASNAEIAASLFMSEATVKAHVSRLLSKLDVNNRVQIAILVHDAGQAGGPP